MKALVVYSSKTGNTEKVAQAIHGVFPQGTEIYRVEDAPEPDDYDLIALGFWIDKGQSDEVAKNYINKIKNKNIALFMTLGAYPDSDHARKSMQNVVDGLNKNNIVLGTFTCQGKIADSLVKSMATLPTDHPHTMSPERKARLEEAAKHPDQKDFDNARAIFTQIIRQYTGAVNA
jgi:flavodoxin